MIKVDLNLKNKKIGLKTFIAYYSGEDIYNFIKEASKKGINILINDKNNFMGNSYIKELDSDNIYVNKLQKLQKTKKYKKYVINFIIKYL